jgi:hypothetical protein
MQHEIVKSLSVTESLSTIAAMIFGKAGSSPGPTRNAPAVGTLDGMMSFAREINGIR